MADPLPSLDDILAFGKQEGRSPDEVASAVRNWHASAREYGESQLRDTDPMGWFRGNAKLDDTVQDELERLKGEKIARRLSEEFQDPRDRQGFTDAYFGSGDLSQADPRYQDFAKRIEAEVIGSDVFNVKSNARTQLIPLQTKSGAMLGDFEAQARPGGDGVDLLVRIDDAKSEDGSRRKALTVPSVTDEEIEAQRKAAESEAKKLREYQAGELQMAEADAREATSGMRGVNQSNADVARRRAEELEARAQILANPAAGRRLLLTERVEEAVKSDKELAGKIGKIDLGEDFWRGFEQSRLGVRLALEDAFGNEQRADRIRGAMAGLSDAFPGSTRFENNGGAGEFTRDLASIAGGMAPTLATAAVSQGASLPTLVTRTAGMLPLSAGVYGTSYGQMLNEADALEAAGKTSEAEQRRADARKKGFFDAMVETGSELVFPEEMLRIGKAGALKNIATSAVQNAAEEALAALGNKESDLTFRDQTTSNGKIMRDAALGAAFGGGMTAVREGVQAVANRVAPKTVDQAVAEKTRETAEAVAAATETAPEVQIQQEKAAELRDNGLPKLAAALEARAEANVDAAVAENVAKVGEVATVLAGRLDEIEAELQSGNLTDERRAELLTEYDSISTDMGLAPEPIANETGIEIPTQLGEQAAEQAANPLPAVSEVQAAGEQAPVGADVANQPEVTGQDNFQSASNVLPIGRNEALTGLAEPTVEGAPIAPDGEQSPAPAPLFQREVTQTEELGPNLVLNVERMESGDWRVAKVNTATGRELPLPDGAPAVFTNEQEALNFAQAAVARPTQEATAAPQEAQAKPAKLSDDDLISLVLSEGIPATYSDISQISKVTRRTGKGFRGIDRDVSRLGEFANAPRIGEFKGNAEAQGVLQRMYRTDESGLAPDILAQQAFEAGLISDPTAEALFEGIKERLRGDATRVATAFNNQEAEAAATNFASQQQANADAFYGNLNSIYRSGGVINAAGLQEGDVLVLGDDTLTVTGATENGPVVLSRKYGEFQLNPQDRVGYDGFESEAGLPVDQRDDSLPDEIVDRAEAETITKRLQEDRRLGNVRAVTSAEHNALSGDRRALDAARRLAAMFGYRIVGVTGANFNGVVVRKEGENDRNIYMRVNPTRPELNIVAHELIHQMRKDAPELYSQMLKSFRADIETYVRDIRPENAGLREDVQIEEFLADYLGERALDPAFWQSLAAKDPGLFEQLADFVLKFLRSIVDRIKKDKIKVEHLIQDAASFRDAVENVLVEFRYRQDAIAKGLIETDTVQFDEDSNMPFADRFTDQDREYLDAVERGDMETAQRMVDEAARAAGYNSPKVYHGTQARFNVFDESKIGSANGRSEGSGFYFTTDRTIAEGYQRNGGNVISAYLKIRKAIDYNQKAFSTLQIRKLLKAVALTEAKDSLDGNWKDGFLANYGDTYSRGIDSIVAEASSYFTDESTALDQIGGIIGSGVDPATVNEALSSSLGYDAFFSKGFSGEGKKGGDIYVATRSNQVKSADPVTYNESGQVIPLSQRFNEASDDIRFADREPQEKRQQEFGVKDGREDVVESLVNDVIPSVKERFFNGEQPVSYWGKEDAARVLADYESGRLDVSKELGKDAGNQALIGELWRYAGRVLAEDGDSTLWHRLKGHMNDFSDREATVSGRVLAARRYYTTLLDGTIKAVNEAKRKIVNDIAPSENGQQVDLAAELEQASREIDNLKRRIDELEKRAPEAFAELDLIPTKAPPKPRGGRRVGPRESALDAQIDADIESFLAGGDLRFADQERETLNKVQFIRDLVRKKSRVSDSTSEGTFINALVESGGLDKAKAKQLYAYAMAKRQERKDAQKVDAEEARKKKVAEQTVQQRLQEAAIKSAARTDKVNRKLNALADKYDKPPKNFKKKGNLDPISASVADAVAQGEKFDRDTFIKRWVSDGADPDVVAKLATSIEVRIQANKAAGRKSNQTPAEQLRAIVNRHKNPMERSRREKSPVRKLATDTLKVESPITEDGFMAQAKTLGIPMAEAQSLWQDLTALRQERQQVREAERQARELEEGTPEQAEAQALIAKLAQSQSDTQDNRPAPQVEISIVEQLYRDAIGFGPVRSRGGFVSELEGAGVDADTANRLFDLALKERANRLEVEKAKVADRTIQNMGVRENQRASSGPLPRLSEEILNHPMLTIAGPQERLEIMARIIEARSGLSAVDARIAAAKFDAQLVKVWEQVSLDVAEKYVLKRNAPGFRKGPGSGTPKEKPSLFDQIRKAIRAGAYDPRRRMLDEVAKQNGWSDLTEEENAELARLDVKLNEPGLTDFESGKIKREMARIINGSSLPDEASKVIREFFLANVFSGLSTLGVQTSALWTQVLNVVLRDSLGAIAGTATGSQRMNLTGYTAALINLTNQFKNAVADSSVALKTGQIRGVTEEEIINAQSKLERVYDRNVKILDDPKASATAKGIALGKILLSASRFFLRNLSMMDNFVQGGIRTYLRDVELFSQAAGLGMSVSDIRKMMSAVLSMSGDFAADAEARGFGNVQIAGRSLPVPSVEKLAYINDRIAMALNDALAGKGIPRSMIEASKDRSYREAAMETGVNEFQTGQFKLLRAGMEALRSVQQKGGVMGAVFIPVLRTVFNMMDRGAWYTPYGLWRLAGVRQKTKGFKEWRTAQGKLTSPYETALADPEQLIRRRMETALGTAIAVGAGALLASQADEPEEERLFRVNLGGPPPSERSKFTAWRKAGHRPYSLQFRSSKDADWSTVGFRRGGMEVFNLAFTVVGAWDQKQFAKRKNESDLEAYGWTVLKELSGELLFPLRPLTSRQASVSADSLAGQIGYYVSGFVPAASLLKTPARFRDFQDYTGPGAAFAAQIPVVQMTLPDTPRLNSLGDPIEARGNSSFDQWARFGIPFGVTPKAPDLKPGQKPEDAHVYMLMRDKEYFPAVKTEADFEGAVTHEQYREFVKKRGKMLKDYVKSNYKTLEGMDAGKFQETLSERGRKITTQVQRQMGIKKP